MSHSRGLRRAIPDAAKPALRTLANTVDPLVIAAQRMRGLSEPVPPRPLRASVGQPSVRGYVLEGRTVARELRDLLASLGHPLDGFQSVCDLASGPGKVLTALHPDPRAAVAAIDVNPAAIRWLAGRMPVVDARAEDPQPPTSFAAASFDLLFSISLFTHLSERSQLAWVAEVGRLLRPGGVGLLTVHGEVAYDGFREARRPGITPAQLTALRGRGPLEEEGFAFEPERNPGRRSPGVEATYGLSFNSPGHIRERWGSLVEVERVLPAALNFRQDAVLVRGSGE